MESPLSKMALSHGLGPFGEHLPGMHIILRPFTSACLVHHWISQSLSYLYQCTSGCAYHTLLMRLVYLPADWQMRRT